MSKSKVVWLLVIIMMMTPSVMAGGKMGLGVKAGLSFADQTWEYSQDLGKVERDSRTGIAVGVFLDFPVTRLASIRPELLYIQKGSQVTVMETTEAYPEGTGRYLTFKDRIDYLSLSLTGKVNLLSGLTGIYVMGGPRLDVKLGTNSDLVEPEAAIIFDSFKDAVPGLTLGLGVERGLGPVATVLLEFRYDFDLSNAMVLDNSVNDIYIENHTFALLAGISF